MRYDLKRLDFFATLIGNHPSHYPRYIAIKDEIVRLGKNNVLFLGCGKGLVEYLLSDQMTCVSFDLDEHEIGCAREINRFKQRRSFNTGDIYNLPLDTERFSVVSISEVIEHLPDDVAALRVARKHLVPNGYLVLTLPNLMRLPNYLRSLLGKPPCLMAFDHQREYTIHAARKLLEDAGFRMLRWRGVCFEFPRAYTADRYISHHSWVRSGLARLLPHQATYLLITAIGAS